MRSTGGETAIAGMVFAGMIMIGSTVGVPATASDDPVAVAAPGLGLPLAGLSEEATLVLVGTALIGLAAAVRRAA